jgi:hypothetical protein
MLSFKLFLEAWVNGIGKESKEKSVTDKTKYSSAKDFKSNSEKIGTVHDLELHRSSSGSGLTHFTWSPHDRMIHHVVHAAEASKNGSKIRLKYLSAHAREGTKTRMGDVYKHLVKHHDVEMIGTGHSVGAQKMWAKFHHDPELQIHSHDPTTGETKKLSPGDKHYADRGDSSNEAKEIGRKHLILSKA